MTKDTNDEPLISATYDTRDFKWTPTGELIILSGKPLEMPDRD